MNITNNILDRNQYNEKHNKDDIEYFHNGINIINIPLNTTYIIKKIIVNDKTIFNISTEKDRYVIKRFVNKKIYSIAHTFKGKFDNPNGPAYILYDKYGNINMIWYMCNGKYHNKFGGPSQIRFDHGDNSELIHYILNGKLHNTNGFALYMRKGKDFSKEWYVNGILHNENGYAVYHCQGKDNIEKQWCLHGKLHNDKGYAYYKRIGKNVEKEWYLNGIIHNENGYAYKKVKIDSFRTNIDIFYSINGNKYRIDGPMEINILYHKELAIISYIHEIFHNDYYINNNLPYKRKLHPENHTIKELCYLRNDNDNLPTMITYDIIGNVTHVKYKNNIIPHNRNRLFEKCAYFNIYHKILSD